MSDTETIVLLVGLFTIIVCVGGIRAKESTGNRSLVLVALVAIVVCLAVAALVNLLR